MYCYQCEQTAKGTGCTVVGVCGKDPKTAALQDLLVYTAEGVSMYAHRARTFGKDDRDADVFVIEALFSTVTNVNFDAERVAGLIRAGVGIRDRVRATYEKAARAAGESPDELTGPATFEPALDIDSLVAQAEGVSIERRKAELGEGITGLQDLMLYGLKGAAAYVDHALILGVEDPGTFAMFHEGLDFLTRSDATAEELLGWCLKTGEINLKAMELLDGANTRSYGHPEPTVVRVTPIKGKAILVSGHDLKDLKTLLEQTEGKGINVYTHGEMLPALAYPELKKHSHLAGTTEVPGRTRPRSSPSSPVQSS